AAAVWPPAAASGVAADTKSRRGRHHRRNSTVGGECWPILRTLHRARSVRPMSQIDSSPALVGAVAPPTRVRVPFNRIVFRGMLFASGLVAIALYRVSRTLTWRFAKVQARNLIRLCGVRVRVRGLERLFDGPCIFTPNHQSHFDIAALLGYLPGLNRFAAKREMFAEPVLGAVLRTMGMIPVDRDDSAAP